jgi:hypothetical protein
MSDLMKSWDESWDDIPLQVQIDRLREAILLLDSQLQMERRRSLPLSDDDLDDEEHEPFAQPSEAAGDFDCE